VSFLTQVGVATRHVTLAFEISEPFGMNRSNMVNKYKKIIFFWLKNEVKCSL